MRCRLSSNVLSPYNMKYFAAAAANDDDEIGGKGGSPQNWLERTSHALLCTVAGSHADGSLFQ